MKRVAFIPARGGSKGIKNKNICMVNGEPLLFYAITAAKYSNVDEVWVSTDSSSIKSVAKSLGAKVIDRPSEISNDKSPSEEALIHFAENVDFDVLVFMQATSPLLQPDHINDGLEMLKEYDSVLSCYREHWLPRWSDDGYPINFDSFLDRGMRQDHGSVWVENGAFYISTKNNILDVGQRVSGKVGFYEMKPQESVQIDNPSDIDFVEKLL
jgi:N-acylneuraminate cytidylyltransferase